MPRRYVPNQVSLVLMLLQFILLPQPAFAHVHSAALADAEQDALPIVWSLPLLLTQTVDQLIDGCVHIAFDASRWTQGFTGTLTYSVDGSVDYRPTPSDRLRLIAVDGTSVDFWIANFQGTTDNSPDEFLDNNYRLDCRGQSTVHGDLTVQVEQVDASLLNLTRHVEGKGNLVYEGQLYEVDAQLMSDIYFESSFGGSEYRNQTQLEGNVRDASLALSLVESFSFQ